MRRALAICLATLAAALLGASPAAAEFGFRELGLEVSGPQAGIVPDEVTTVIDMETTLDEGANLEFPEGRLEDLEVDMPAGFAGTPSAMPHCAAAGFAVLTKNGPPACPNSSAVGFAAVKAEYEPLEPGIPGFLHVPVYNLAPAPGKAAKLGFYVLAVPVTIDVGVREAPPFNVFARIDNISQAAVFYASKLTLWGKPAAAAHDALRGACLDVIATTARDEPVSNGKCKAETVERAFLNSPRSCEGPLDAGVWGRAWNSGEEASGIASAPARSGCSKLGFAARADAAPTTTQASSASGLSFELQIEDEGIASVKEGATAYSDIKRATVTLPEGMTLNPAQAEGLAVCSEAQAGRERAASPFGAGCPAASRVGAVEVRTPLLPDTLLQGSLFVAEPYANPFGSLIALYMTIKDPTLGVAVTVPAKVSPDPKTGQVITTFGDPSAADPALRTLPQMPLSSVRVTLRGGSRSPLVTPPACGPHTVSSLFTPWANPDAPYPIDSTFEIDSGPGGAGCPQGGAPPFDPGFEAGTLSNSAGSYSPFVMRLTRADGEQDLTRFDATLPPGVVGRIAGLTQCPEAQIAQARARSGAHGGQEEIEDPSCPASSKIGATLAGAGVGSQLTYVGGSLYLAGPYGGAPLSVVAVVPGRAGPFDVGTIVVREALALNPLTARVEVDGAASDPIPHILKGIPLAVRDIRVFADRPDFTVNATDCSEEQTEATIFGGFTDLFSAADDVPRALAARYQAADCATLGFGPKLDIRLRGGARRGDFPALRAVVTPRPGDANFQRAVVTLPSSAFLEQAHIRTICTRAQFAAAAGNGSQCPPGSIYGHASAWSPLLDGPATGPVFLRSSDHNLPDLVVALKGPASAPFEVELAARIDSSRGGIRSTFKAIPDIAVSRFVLKMQGGRKGLIVNSRNLCAKKQRAKVSFKGQNGKTHDFRPVVKADCGKKGKKGGKGKGR